MRALLNRVPIYRLLNHSTIKHAWMLCPCRETERDYHSTPANLKSAAAKVERQLPELSPAPRYPCPFLTATDIETYVLPLYRFGWGISRVPVNTSATKPTPPATQLSKRFILPHPDVAERFVTDITRAIIEPENHHPILAQQSQGALSVVDIHVHTHTARAPPNRQNTEDQEKFTRKRPGITHRDIRFAILVERLLLDYIPSRLVDSEVSAYPQPTNIDSLHNFRALSLEAQDPTEK